VTDPSRVTSTALAHLRICDLSGQLAGAGATRWLAAFGAQVIRIEDPVRRGRWDRLRGAPPHIDDRRDIESGGAFNNHNVEKLGVTLNLRTDRGQELFGRLVAVSDVVVENFSAGVMDRMGLGYDRLRTFRPDIIYASSSGFGHSGPYVDFKTWGPIVQALCGLTAASGHAGLPPAGLGFSYMDHHGANLLAIAIMAALIHRELTGEGQWIDMATTEAGSTMLGPSVLAQSRPAPGRNGPRLMSSNREPGAPMSPHNVYRCAGDDHWIAIACRHDGDWSRLAAAIDEPWARDPELARLAGRVAQQDHLDARIEGWTAGQSAADVEELLVGAGVPAAEVASPQRRIDDHPVSQEWGLWPTVRHSRAGQVRVDGVPVHLSETDWTISRGAPLLGEHNDQVYGELLGLSAEERGVLAAEGIL
jgi:benzylsuccinate CoA-transferase BbsF subunit